MKETAVSILEKYWGFTSFRGSQKQIIESVLNGQDVLALLPTGGGKSVCDQVPPLLTDGICVVVSPLIALIRDQVSQLKSRGIKAVALTGGISFEETNNLLDNCLYGGYKFLYLSPERLQQQIVQDRIGQMNVSLIAIDEAHCISQWGIDFRPAYLECSILRMMHPEVPCIALTATATQRVSKDIVTNLELRSPLLIKDSFLRENLIYKVSYQENKNQRLIQMCKSDEASCIVYVRSRRRSEELASLLNQKGISASHFHGGIPRDEKEKKLQQWLGNKKRIMVATSAFGMGIDKPDVARVIHYEMPESIENYFQEAGRAGRNGAQAEAVLLISGSDEQRLLNQFIKVLPDVAFIKLLYNKLNNYFQVPYGILEEENHPFNFNNFCDAYELNTSLVYNGMRLLDQNSVIALSQNFSNKTSVQFLASKNAIFSYLEKHPKEAQILQVLLRTYGGVFEFDTKINTLLIAKKSEVAESAVFTALKKAEMDGIIAFNHEKQDMELTFLVPREDDRTINVFAHKIRDLNQGKIDNVNAMLTYVKNRKECRTLQLLAYFGEKGGAACGKCDVCLKKILNSPEELKTLDSDILALLKEQSVSSQGLVEFLGHEREVILKELQFLLEEGKIKITSNNEYTVSK
ncbi:MAG: RecQ family ATP-dependent DNA helicase [Eudoraea sp.]|nr:RecQ family ATP-dependent DNA helicase [Eudoraea sp.]